MPILAETSLVIADPQVRHVGTLGGNVANGDPGNDMPAVMMCLGATYQVAGRKGERRLAAREFYQGTYLTALDCGRGPPCGGGRGGPGRGGIRSPARRHRPVQGHGAGRAAAVVGPEETGLSIPAEIVALRRKGRAE